MLESFITLDLSLMIVMGYIVFCVYYALFKLKFSNYYGLYWNKQTDASSLMFFAMYLFSYKEMDQEFLRHFATTFCKLLTTNKLLSQKLWEPPT